MEIGYGRLDREALAANQRVGHKSIRVSEALLASDRLPQQCGWQLVYLQYSTFDTPKDSPHHSPNPLGARHVRFSLLAWIPAFPRVHEGRRGNDPRFRGDRWRIAPAGTVRLVQAGIVAPRFSINARAQQSLGPASINRP